MHLQGKSLSLICSALTWLRNHKRGIYEAGLEETAKNMAGEPDWMLDTALKRKREELMKKWEEREARLERVRAREKMMEEKGRGSKRQRVDGGREKRKEVDEEAEFWIGDWEGGADGVASDDPFSLLSKETRDLLSRVGLGRVKEEEEEEGEQEDEIKVCHIWLGLQRKVTDT